ncbi:MAG: nitrate reductase subunit alpha [Deltaproteobacteria bacterium GWB2_55_19]|nr:MAG: nitrate reductase subunit alpha [Deltaproteobacteria bacterium GWB2_55_19]
MSNWIQDEINPGKRGWEEFYRNRWQYDKTVRSTHGNNCTGGCSWMVYVKDGIITWELQAVDYPKLDQSLPPYEPRGCQRGISASWYVYSPVRIKYPYVRGIVIDAWKEARSKHADPVDAWRSIVENAELSKKIKWSRGKGGFRRFDWDTAAEIIVSAQIYTIKKYGPDRNIAFSPIPAMSQISYTSGARYNQLIGGVHLSFYDYYTDLPNAEPEVWGEQTDSCESADWYNAGYVVMNGANPNMTRTADAHFVSELRMGGAKLVVCAPDYSQVTKYADLWVPLKTGSDTAFWLGVNHVILKEYFVDKKTPYFDVYCKNYTDLPNLVKLTKGKDGYELGRYLKACDLAAYAEEDNPEWKFCMWDEKTGKARVVNGGMGYRYPQKHESHGKWNTLLKDGKTGEDISPALTLLDIKDDAIEVVFHELDKPERYKRQVPVKYVETKEGRTPVTTVFDLYMAHCGVGRKGLSGDYCKNYDDDRGFSPAWQEKYTGIGRDTIIQVGREFASNAEVTKGRSMIICGASFNHWYHSDLMYRSGMNALMLCGCVGRNGGGLQHYVGQEKLAPFDSWGQIAHSLDWVRPPRLMSNPINWYLHTQQFKYDSAITDYHVVPDKSALEYQHTADYAVRSVRLGWMPGYPQFNKSSIALYDEAQRSGAKTDADVVDYVVKQLKSGTLDFAIADPDAPENWPRVWLIWRANALGSSARGQEYFFKFLLGTHNNLVTEEVAKPYLKELKYRESPLGKLDLLVDLNMRMNTTPTYCDIVLPAAHWYEKEDINTTELHSFIHPMGAAVQPNWESKSDYDAYRFLSEKFAEIAKKHFPRPVKEVMTAPLGHDTPGEIAQPALNGVQDWKKGQCEAIPGKTMPSISVVERDYANIDKQYISVGPLMKGKYGFHGIMLDGKDLYENYLKQEHIDSVDFNGQKFISIRTAKEACNFVMAFSGTTNGEVGYRQWVEEEHHTGLHAETYDAAKKAVREIYPEVEFRAGAHGLAEEIAGPDRNFTVTYDDIVAQPRRWLTSALWTGDNRKGRAYGTWTIQTERRVPWRTLTGKQHFYLDHPIFLEYGEGLCAHKYKLNPARMNELQKSDKTDALMLNYITPHSKWAIHSTHYDNLRMLTLSRGGNSCWVNDKDAESVGIKDNDWVEAYNDNGIFVCRAVVSARIPTGTCFAYHSQERTINIPKAEQRNKIRGGFHNSLTRQRLKPTLMTGGYGQFSYAFNGWGPIPIIRDTTVLVRKMRNQEVKW